MKKIKTSKKKIFTKKNRKINPYVDYVIFNEKKNSDKLLYCNYYYYVYLII